MRWWVRALSKKFALDFKEQTAVLIDKIKKLCYLTHLKWVI
jgi:hypothetical protein